MKTLMKMRRDRTTSRIKKDPDHPKKRSPKKTWEHRRLYSRVRRAIHHVPHYFESDTFYKDIEIEDLHTLNTTLGASIERAVVIALNKMRSSWDPEDKYPEHEFVRQSQVFPDVILTDSPRSTPIMGVELKGWFLLSREGEPSFRYQVTPAACARADLLVVVPWVLSHAMAGRAIIFPPYIELARYAAEYRNFWWQHTRKANSSAKIVAPKGVHPYPKSKTRILDKPQGDESGNFGRYARTGLMDDFVAESLNEKIRGVIAKDWLHFLQQCSPL